MALACAVAAPLLGPAASAGATSGPPPYDVVIPPVTGPQLVNDRVGFAGATGYKRIAPGGTTWVPYDGSPPRPTTSTVPEYGIRLPDGSEKIATTWLGKARLTDPATGTSTDIGLPAGSVLEAATGTPDGWAMLTATRSGSTPADYVYGFHLLAVRGTTVVSDTPLTGIPNQGVVVRGGTPTAESGGRLVLEYESGDELGVSLVDPVGGAVDTLQDFIPEDGAHQVVKTADSIGWYSAGTVHLASTADPRTENRTITLPPELHADTTKYVVTLTDSAVLALRSGSAWNDGRNDPLYSVPLSGSPATELLPDAADLTIAEDGSVVVSGGPDAASWDAYHILPGGGAPIDLFHIRELTPVRYGLVLDQGRLTFMEGMPDSADRFTEGALYSQDEGVKPVPAPVGAPRTVPLTPPVTTCDAQHHCSVHLVGGLSSGPAYVGPAADGKDIVYAGYSAQVGGVPLDSTGGRIVDASENYVVYDSGSNGKQYVVQPGYGTVALTRPIAPAALWGDTLWTASTTRGRVDQLDLRSRYSDGPVVRASVTTDAPCAIKELQALGNRLYWSCGASGPAGVYDRTAGRSVPVPAGPALLGDGFVLRHPGDELQVTDTTTGATRTVAALPAEPDLPGGDRGVTWTVDKFRGQIAYTAPGATTHLIPSGTAPSPLAAQSLLDPQTSADARGHGWEISLLLSGPAASWTLGFRPAAGGAPVRTITGGPTATRIESGWTGKDDAGRYVPVGTYTWTLTVTPANGIGPDLVLTGPLDLHRSLAVPHDYTDDGVGDLLAMTSSGRLDVRAGTGKGTLLPAGARQSTGWPTTSTYIPIGELTSDGGNCLLVRTATGVLTRYNTPFTGNLTPSTPHVTIGSGWNVYNLLTSPGDLNRDGRPDLVARDAAGSLYFYAGTASGVLAPKVRIGGGWNTYTLMAGTGAGGLLARDASGVLWRYGSNGTGGFTPRTRIGAGWNTYDTLTSPGDLTSDGRPDLLARDAAGDLWRYDTTASGTFTPRTLIGPGWTAYTTLR